MKRITSRDKINENGVFAVCHMHLGQWIADKVELDEGSRYKATPLFPKKRPGREPCDSMSFDSLFSLFNSIPHCCVYECESETEIQQLVDNIATKRDPYPQENTSYNQP